MHEVSIAFGMIDEVMRIARENKAQKVTSINLRIGKMSGIVIDSLKFAFDAIKLEHPLLIDSEILIEEIPLMYECKNCKNIFNPEDVIPPCPPLSKGGWGDFRFPACPECKSYSLKLISGEEMNIENLEVEV